MDNFLVDYLKSGKAWVLVGSGPSNAIGYPSWKRLAEIAANEVRIQGGEEGSKVVGDAMSTMIFL